MNTFALRQGWKFKIGHLLTRYDFCKSYCSKARSAKNETVRIQLTVAFICFNTETVGPSCQSSIAIKFMQSRSVHHDNDQENICRFVKREHGRENQVLPREAQRIDLFSSVLLFILQ